ncbi:hypothetical protein ACFOUS_22170, partial [Deinococcus metalli]
TSGITCFNCDQPMPENSERHPGLHEYVCEACTVTVANSDKFCEVCGRTTNLMLYPLWGGTGVEYLCPQHSQERALNKAAHDHLTALLEHTVREWVLHWGQTAASVDDIADAIEWCFMNQNEVRYPERLARVRSLLGRP